MTTTTRKLDYITVLRAAAILMVLAVHVSQIDQGEKYIHPYLTAILGNGARGVQLFYLLSAFTLFLSFHHRADSEAHPVRNYFIRRFFRIAPLFYLAIIYYLWQDGTGPRYWLGDAPGISTANIISNFIFLHGFSPYWINSVVFGGWSIGIEMSFYLLLPFLFRRIRDTRQALNFLMISLLIRMVFFVVLSHYVLIKDHELWNNYLLYYFPNQLPVFAFGIVLYFVIYEQKPLNVPPKALFIYGFFILFALSIGYDVLLTEASYFVFAFFIIAYALHRYHPALLFNRFFLYIGKISFTLYLTHWAAIHWLEKYHIVTPLSARNETGALLNLFVNYGLVLLVAVLLSTVLYHAVEAPGQQLGKKLIAKLERK